MAIAAPIKSIYDIWPDLLNTDFVVGRDQFDDIQIDSTAIHGFWYFKNIKKGLIKRFVLEESPQIQKMCTITLIKKDSGKFTPRFEFGIWNKTKKAFNEYSKKTLSKNFIKARVDLASCYENFLSLLSFMKNIGGIDFSSKSYVVMDQVKKEIFDNIPKNIAISSFVDEYGPSISEQDITLLQNRRSKLEYFHNLLKDSTFFNSEREKIGPNKRDEDVWQFFFENNTWIFGYGLQLVACEGLEARKLEQIVTGYDLFNPSGKRIDALLKTKGNISKILFCEIKTHFPNILIEPYPNRPGVFVPAKDLRGAVAQIQKTIHKARLALQENFLKLYAENSDPTGEELLFVKPRGIVVIGKLDDFKTSNGINYEMLSSFEIYRQQISGIEILTYDELYERAKFIVEK